MVTSHASSLVEISGLIEHIYAAAMNPALWPMVLTEIGRAVSDGTQTLLFLPGRDPLPGVLRCERTPDSVLFPFLEYYSSVNVLAEPCDRIFPDGTVRLSHVAIQDAEFERSEFYADFFRKNQLFYSCGIKEKETGGGLNYLSMQRDKSQSAFSEAETAILRLLMPHLRRALSLQAQLARHADQSHTAGIALAAFGKVVFGVGARGQVTFATKDAEALLTQEGPFYLRTGRLHVRDPRLDERLQQRVRSVLQLSAPFANSHAEALVVPSRNISQDASDASTPTTHHHAAKVVILPMRHAGFFADGTPGALICISDATINSHQHLSHNDALLRELFNLTPIESRTAISLAQGSEVKAIAASLNKSEAAIRFHLKQVFQKTRTHRQAELIHLLSSLPQHY